MVLDAQETANAWANGGQVTKQELDNARQVAQMLAQTMQDGVQPWQAMGLSAQQLNTILGGTLPNVNTMVNQFDKLGVELTDVTGSLGRELGGVNPLTPLQDKTKAGFDGIIVLAEDFVSQMDRVLETGWGRLSDTFARKFVAVLTTVLNDEAARL